MLGSLCPAALKALHVIRMSTGPKSSLRLPNSSSAAAHTAGSLLQPIFAKAHRTFASSWASADTQLQKGDFEGWGRSEGKRERVFRLTKAS